MSFLPANFWLFFMVSYLPVPVNSSVKHLPHTLGPLPWTTAKANPISLQPSMVNGI